MPVDILDYVTRIYGEPSEESIAPVSAPTSETIPETLIPRPYILSSYHNFQGILDERSAIKQRWVELEGEMLYDEIAKTYSDDEGAIRTDVARTAMFVFVASEIVESLAKDKEGVPAHITQFAAETLDLLINHGSSSVELSSATIRLLLGQALQNYTVYINSWNSNIFRNPKTQTIASEMIIAYEALALTLDPTHKYIPGFRFNGPNRSSWKALYLPPVNSFRHHPDKFGERHRLLG